jgi:hypothetical protein
MPTTWLHVTVASCAFALSAGAAEIDYPAKPAVGSADEVSQRFLYSPDRIPAGTLVRAVDLEVTLEGFYVPESSVGNLAFNGEAAFLEQTVVLGGELDANHVGKQPESYAGELYAGFAPQALRSETLDLAFYGFVDRGDEFSGFGRAIAVFRPAPITLRGWVGPAFSSTGVGYNSGVSAAYSLRVAQGHLISVRGGVQADGQTFSSSVSTRGVAEMVYQWKGVKLGVKFKEPFANIAAFQLGSWMGYAL